jgi:2-dehydropantoate 2-reductase
MFKTLIREVVALAGAMGIQFKQDLVQVNLAILANLAPESTTSMQRDVMAEHDSEMDGLIFEVVRLGQKYGVPVPEYRKVAEKYGYQ